MPTPPTRALLRLSALLLVILAILFAFNAGAILEINGPAPSDVIVVLAGETDHRPAEALKLLDQGYAPRVILNVPANSRLYNFTQLQIAEQYVRQLPEAGAIEICPIQGLSTRDESHDVAACLLHKESARILIVTSDFHTRRALSIFRHEFPEKSFSIAAVHDNTQFGTRWWQHRQWAKTCLDEWLRLIWWNVIERWR